ncbi:hypothetical protein G7Z17_g7981 [Cylindrodendrum hubeiense]|uniref:Uncharacterized protein n=1 Tax=Cylindrodendrum hubeiense TaxID=595255 RepID=A0A9P5H9H2_9HYPO|nr:hypothetical protein G7Z17_g7981 [Cylindrodendrum hubeiense]
MGQWSMGKGEHDAWRDGRSAARSRAMAAPLGSGWAAMQAAGLYRGTQNAMEQYLTGPMLGHFPRAVDGAGADSNAAVRPSTPLGVALALHRSERFPTTAVGSGQRALRLSLADSRPLSSRTPRSHAGLALAQPSAVSDAARLRIHAQVDGIKTAPRITRPAGADEACGPTRCELPRNRWPMMDNCGGELAPPSPTPSLIVMGRRARSLSLESLKRVKV